MSEDIDFPVHSFGRKLGALIDISRVIDRNSDDGALDRRGGEILYVFDTNVVQMFLEPYKNPRFAETFFTRIWSDDADRDLDINTQNCLLTSEYLLSGWLPGQRFRRWYMTEDHQGELDRQMSYLGERVNETADRLRDDPKFGKFALARIEELKTILALDPKRDRILFYDLARDQGLPDEKVKELQALDDARFSERAAGIRSRAACRLLAQDRFIEPAYQLRRLRSAAILGRRARLEHGLRPTDADWEMIREDSLAWRRVISDILRRDETKFKSKTDSAMSADCDALALVSWGNRHWAGPNRRIIFVTGDRVLLEACRQRYVNEVQQWLYFARPVMHFAPVFNPSSARSQVERIEVFERLRKALEAAMIPLNLGLLAGEEPDRRLRARDGFALLVDQALDGVAQVLTDFFPMIANADWVAEQLTALNRLVSDLQLFELRMLEAFPHFVAVRLSPDRQRFFSDAAEAGSSALASDITGLLETAMTDGVRFSGNMIAGPVAELLKGIDPAFSSDRVSIQVRLSFTDAHEYLDFRQTVASLKAQAPDELRMTLEHLAATPERIFALAAMLAFSLEAWKDAVQYAEFAAASGAMESELRITRPRASVDETASAEDPAGCAVIANEAERQARADHYELLFLHATALRFQLAAFDASVEGDCSAIWREWRNRAHLTLNRCMSFHTRMSEWARALRGCSERAAVNLTFCEQLIFGDERQLPPPDALIKSALHSLSRTVVDLVRCDVLYERAERRTSALRASGGGEASAAILAAATRQYRFNILAMYAAGERLRQLAPEHGEAISKMAARVTPRRPGEWPNMPRIARAYLAFVDRDWDILRSIALDDISLVLDRRIIHGLQAMTP